MIPTCIPTYLLVPIYLYSEAAWAEHLFSKIICSYQFNTNSVPPVKVKGEESGRGWDDWIASPTQWTWTWANSEIQWRIERAGLLQSMGSQRVRHGLVTEQQQFNMLFRIQKRTGQRDYHSFNQLFLLSHTVMKILDFSTVI